MAYRKKGIKKPELMAPAGDWISLRAAIDAGCDSVYFGIRGLNMREGAENFKASEMKKLVRQCHEAGVRAYLTLNTITYEEERALIKKTALQAEKAGVDAVICWDFSIIQEALHHKIPVYISTQMSVSNSSSILFFYRNLGIRRFVLARECSLEHIRKIRRSLARALGPAAEEIEIEVFIHGAMCVSLSGRCFLSHLHTGKSANRGQCLQPCRRQYTIMEEGGHYSYIMGNNYLLSPRDICVLPFIEKLLNAGISCFKIEGRNRSPEYTATTTAAYRTAIDFYFENRFKKSFQSDFHELKNRLMEGLRKVYNRGFSPGFFLGKPADQWTEAPGSLASAKKQFSGIVTNYYRKIGVAEIKVQSNAFSSGTEIMFQGTKTGVFSQVAESIEVDHRKVKKASKGMTVAVKTLKPVRPNDRVYVIKHSNPV